MQLLLRGITLLIISWFFCLLNFIILSRTSLAFFFFFDFFFFLGLFNFVCFIPQFWPRPCSSAKSSKTLPVFLSSLRLCSRGEQFLNCVREAATFYPFPGQKLCSLHDISQVFFFFFELASVWSSSFLSSILYFVFPQLPPTPKTCGISLLF